MSVREEVLCRRPAFAPPPEPKRGDADDETWARMWAEHEEAVAGVGKARASWIAKHVSCEDRLFRPGETIVVEERAAETFRRAHPAAGAEWAEEVARETGAEHGAKCDRCDDGDVVEASSPKGAPKAKRCAHCGRRVDETSSEEVA